MGSLPALYRRDKRLILPYAEYPAECRIIMIFIPLRQQGCFVRRTLAYDESDVLIYFAEVFEASTKTNPLQYLGERLVVHTWMQEQLAANGVHV